MKNRGIPYVVLIVGVFFLATSAVFAKVADAPSTIIAFYRLLLASAVLMPIALFNKNTRRELLELSKKQILLSMVSGVFLALHYVLWFESLNYTSVASSTVIVTLQPIFAVIGSYFLYKEKLNKGAMFGILMAIGGSFIIGWGDFRVSGEALYGDLLALVSAAIITAYFFVGKHIRQNVSVITYSLLGYISSSVFLGLYAFNMKMSFVDYSRNTWIMFMGLALISTILGQMMLNWVVKWLSTSVVTVGILSESIWAIIFSFFILHEKISIGQTIGIIVILSGLLIFTLKYNEKEKINMEEVNI